MQLNRMRGLLSLKTLCITAIEAHHPDTRLVDSCECKNRDKNHLSQTLACHKNYEAYQINCILCVVKRNRMIMPIFYQQNHEKNMFLILAIIVKSISVHVMIGILQGMFATIANNLIYI
jgi:hypothetical protein